MSTNLSAISRSALILSAKVANNPEFEAAIGFAVKTSEDNKITAGVVYLAVLAAIGAKDLAAAPHPDTDASDTNNPDKYSIDAKDGTTIKGTFWNDFADSTAFGVEYMRELDWINNRTKMVRVPNPSNPGGEPVDNPYTTMPDELIRVEKKKWDNRKTTIRSTIKKAKKLHDQIERCNGLSGVEVKFRTSTENERTVPESLMPIRVRDTSPDRDEFVRRLAISEFNALRPLECVGKQGNMWELLLKSGGRGTKTPDAATTAAQAGLPVTIETVETTFASIAHWLDEPKNRAAFAKELSKNDALKLSFGDLIMATDSSWNSISDWYTAQNEKVTGRKDAKAA